MVVVCVCCACVRARLCVYVCVCVLLCVWAHTLNECTHPLKLVLRHVLVVVDFTVVVYCCTHGQPRARRIACRVSNACSIMRVISTEKRSNVRKRKYAMQALCSHGVDCA